MHNQLPLTLNHANTSAYRMTAIFSSNFIPLLTLSDADVASFLA